VKPQSAQSTIEAVFCSTTEEQISSFERDGFALIRRKDAQNLGDLAGLETAILELVAKKRATGWLFKLLRALNLSGEYVVRAPERRFSIPLSMDMTTALGRVLSAAVCSAFPLLSSQLAKNAHLVDVASIISYPGSERQKTHSDVPHRAHKIVVGFVALTAVTMSSGPTCIFKGSHTAAFHSMHVGDMSGTEALHRAKHYSPNGDLDSDSSSDSDCCEAAAPLPVSAADTAAVNFTAQSAPTAAVLEAGDVLIYNSAVFHYGGANVSAVPRALLMFSFQEPTPWGDLSEVTGFTYNHDVSVRGKFNLDSFRPVS